MSSEDTTTSSHCSTPCADSTVDSSSSSSVGDAAVAAAGEHMPAMTLSILYVQKFCAHHMLRRGVMLHVAWWLMRLGNVATIEEVETLIYMAIKIVEDTWYVPSKHFKGKTVKMELVMAKRLDYMLYYTQPLPKEMVDPSPRMAPFVDAAIAMGVPWDRVVSVATAAAAVHKAPIYMPPDTSKMRPRYVPSEYLQVQQYTRLYGEIVCGVWIGAYTRDESHTLYEAAVAAAAET